MKSQHQNTANSNCSKLVKHRQLHSQLRVDKLIRLLSLSSGNMEGQWIHYDDQLWRRYLLSQIPSKWQFKNSCSFYQSVSREFCTTDDTYNSNNKQQLSTTKQTSDKTSLTTNTSQYMLMLKNWTDKHITIHANVEELNKIQCWRHDYI